MLKIDTHAHWFPQEWVDTIIHEGPKCGVDISRNEQGRIIASMPGIRLRPNFTPPYIDIGVRLKMMDEARVDVHALSLTSPMVHWAPAELGVRLAQVFNDGCARVHAQHPTRFVGMATLPMQAPDLAVAEVKRAAQLPGIRGVYLPTHINGKNLEEKEFWPVYEQCEKLSLPIFLHPVAPVGKERTGNYHLGNFLGNPYESGIAAASLIFGGVMDAFPKLDVMLPHAGGTFPWLIGRMDHGTTVRAECKHMTKPPSAYLKRFHYDTITHSDSILMYLIDHVGADRVVMGSDCPADMSYTRPVDVVERLKDLSAAQRDEIVGGNAAKLLKIA
jgi:aminocarboxymuconate-semialdehyde decarboxylase